MHADTETDLPEENCATFKEAFFAVCPDERVTFEMFGREGPAPRPEEEEGRLWEESPQPAGNAKAFAIIPPGPRTGGPRSGESGAAAVSALSGIGWLSALLVSQ